VNKMKIAIPSDDGRNIALHFGRSRNMIIYDIENNKINNREVRDNKYCPHRNDICLKTVSKQSAEYIERICNKAISGIYDCQVFIGRHMNKVAIDNLTSHNIKVLIVDEKDADTAVEKYLLDILVEVENPLSYMCSKTQCIKK